MKLRPLNNRLIVLPDEEGYFDATLPKQIVESLKAGRIVLPEAYEGYLKKVSPFGKIVSWGNYCRYKHKEGEKVWFGQFSFEKLEWDGKWYWILSEDDIHAKVEE